MQHNTHLLRPTLISPAVLQCSSGDITPYRSERYFALEIHISLPEPKAAHTPYEAIDTRHGELHEDSAAFWNVCGGVTRKGRRLEKGEMKSTEMVHGPLDAQSDVHAGDDNITMMDWQHSEEFQTIHIVLLGLSERRSGSGVTRYSS